jgi:hypothetical protein
VRGQEEKATDINWNGEYCAAARMEQNAEQPSTPLILFLLANHFRRNIIAKETLENPG